MHGRHVKEDAAELRALSLELSPWFCHAVTRARTECRPKSAIGVLRKYDIK
ncbi:MAG TPA: hypothetical protein VLM75_06595 [Spirochaetota bacterium]|nr:hypothetical protein [Spirochaetota bacterium]